MVRTLAVIFGMSCLLAADDELRQKVQVTKTEHVDFPPGGTVRLKNSTGEITIEGWDQAGVEITTIKSTKDAYASSEREKATHDLDRVQIATERRGDQLVISTGFAGHRGFPPSSLLGGARNFDLDYRIKVPREARLVVDHDVGDVHIDDVTGDIHATARQGEITIHLPEGAQYAIDARSHLGSVTSDFPGNAKRRFWLVGHQFIQASQAPHKLYLREGFGDIIILKILKAQIPPYLNR
jgi:hypothetical protein